MQILPRHTRIGAICERIGARRGRNIGVDAAREQLEMVYYGLRDNTVRSLRPHLRRRDDQPVEPPIGAGRAGHDPRIPGAAAPSD